jgi:hypothetical protein
MVIKSVRIGLIFVRWAKATRIPAGWPGELGFWQFFDENTWRPPFCFLTQLP